VYLKLYLIILTVERKPPRQQLEQEWRSYQGIHHVYTSQSTYFMYWGTHVSSMVYATYLHCRCWVDVVHIEI
jgi:hypothetical protein